MKPDFKLAWRLATALFPTRWLHLLVFIPMVSLLIFLSVKAADGADRADPASTALGCFLWFVTSGGCLITAYQAHQLTIPRIKKYSVRTLASIYILLFVIPALFTHHTTYMLAIGTLCALGILIMHTLKGVWASLIWVVPVLANNVMPKLSISVTVGHITPIAFGTIFIIGSLWFIANWRNVLQKEIGKSQSPALF